MSNDYNEGVAEVATPGPFPGVTEEQAENYASALVRELEGYEAKVEQCKAAGDEAGVKRYTDRIKQVKDSQKALAEGAETGAKRAAKRAAKRGASTADAAE